jgi:hypothetical protein
MLLTWIQEKRAASNHTWSRSREQSLRQNRSSNCPKCGDPLTGPWIKWCIAARRSMSLIAGVVAGAKRKPFLHRIWTETAGGRMPNG